MPLMLYFAPSLNLNPAAAAGAEIVKEGTAAGAAAAAGSVGAVAGDAVDATATACGADVSAGLAAGDAVAVATDSVAACPNARETPETATREKRHAMIEMVRDEVVRLKGVKDPAFVIEVHAVFPTGYRSCPG